MTALPEAVPADSVVDRAVDLVDPEVDRAVVSVDSAVAEEAAEVTVDRAEVTVAQAPEEAPREATRSEDSEERLNKSKQSIIYLFINKASNSHLSQIKVMLTKRKMWVFIVRACAVYYRYKVFGSRENT